MDELTVQQEPNHDSLKGMDGPEPTIQEHASRLRDLLNLPHQRHELMDSERWNPVWIALDSLELAQEAIDAYRSEENVTTGGALYLRIVGLLSVMVMQQDSCFEFCIYAKINLDLEEYELLDIRDLRNSVIHQIRRKDGSSHMVPMHMISHDRMVLLSYPDFKKKEWGIPEIIHRQERGINSIVCMLIDAIAKNEQKYRDEFREISLASIFSSLDYPLEKILAGTWSSSTSDRIMAQIGLKIIREKVDEFKEHLGNRGIRIGEEISTFDRIEYALDQLYTFYEESGHDHHPPAEAAFIFAKYLISETTDLEKWAAEIDDSFQSDVDPQNPTW